MAIVGYEHRPITKAPNWHGLVVWDLLFNNLATGLFLAAACGELAAGGVPGVVPRVAYPVALGLLLVDLACLVLDLGDPLRFHHMLRVFKPTSPMSLGTWCLTAFATALSFVVALKLLDLLGFGPARGSIAGYLHWLGVIAGIPFAFGSAAYKGVLFSTTAQPGWKDARWLGGYLTHSAVTLGCAVLLAISTVVTDRPAAATLRVALLLLLVLNGGLAALAGRELLPAARTTSGRHRVIASGVCGLLASVALPALLLAVTGPSIVPALLALVLLVAGHYLVRRAIVFLPHDLEPIAPHS